MWVARVILQLPIVSLKKKEGIKEASEINFTSRFYLTQHIQNTIILICNQKRRCFIFRFLYSVFKKVATLQCPIATSGLLATILNRTFRYTQSWLSEIPKCQNTVVSQEKKKKTRWKKGICSPKMWHKLLCCLRREGKRETD